MNTHGFSLRSTLTATVIMVVSLAVLISAVLIGMTTLLHRTTAAAAASVESVRLAQEAEIDLLLHGRPTDALVRRDLQENMTRRLLEAARYVTSDPEASVLAQAEALIATYIASARDPDVTSMDLAAHQEAAYGALESLVTINVAQARHANAAATSWNRRANYTGTSVVALLLFGAAGLLFWLRSRAFAPVFALAAAMERFGKGERGARAEERGPAELREMSRRFNEMAALLAAQRQAQIAFLGGVAHDLRNPLSVLKMSVAVVSPDRPLPPEQLMRQMMEKIARQIGRLERMASDFIDISKIESGELELKLDVHDARALVREVVSLFQGTVPEPRLLVSLPTEKAVVYCDHLRIEQVLTNLVSNAIKYSPPGSVIEAAVTLGDSEVELRVSDQGIGIPEAEQGHIFEPFRRAALSRDAVPGVGLGLFVVRRIVEAHGGRIEVESRLAEGSTFRVYLPRANRPQEPSEHRREASPCLAH